MTRPIDANALKQMIDFRMWDVDDDYPHDEASKRISEDHAVKKIIDDMPTIDAVQVIRCKDCKHRDPEDKKCDCGHFIRWQLPRSDEWFCADAERKEE